MPTKTTLKRSSIFSLLLLTYRPVPFNSVSLVSVELSEPNKMLNNPGPELYFPDDLDLPQELLLLRLLLLLLLPELLPPPL